MEQPHPAACALEWSSYWPGVLHCKILPSLRSQRFTKHLESVRYQVPVFALCLGSGSVLSAQKDKESALGFRGKFAMPVVSSEVDGRKRQEGLVVQGSRAKAHHADRSVRSQ